MKKILMYAGIVIAGSLLYGQKKVTATSNFLKDLEIKIRRVNKFNLNGFVLTVNLNIGIINKTSQNFNVNTGNVINLEKVEFFTNTGIKLGEALKPISNINLAANGETLIDDIDVILDLSNFGPLLLGVIQNLPANIQVKAHVNVMGQTIII